MSPDRARRSLLAVLAGSLLPPGLHAQSPPSWTPGLQLYTVRDALDADVEATLRRVADIGYRQVELAGLPRVSALAMRTNLQRFGLDVPSMHASYDKLRGEFAAVVDEARTLGATFLVCPSVDAGQRKTSGDWKRVCETLNGIGHAARARDLVFAYHNHDFEFAPFADGITPFRLLMTETDPRAVKLELDVYWVAKAGQDPLQYLEKAADRIALVHLKDLGKDGSTVELGRGVLPMQGIVGTALRVGAAHLFVEQDDSADPFASVATSFMFLERLRLQR